MFRSKSHSTRRASRLIKQGSSLRRGLDDRGSLDGEVFSLVVDLADPRRLGVDVPLDVEDNGVFPPGGVPELVEDSGGVCLSVESFLKGSRRFGEIYALDVLQTRRKPEGESDRVNAKLAKAGLVPPHSTHLMRTSIPLIMRDLLRETKAASSRIEVGGDLRSERRK